MTALRDLAAVVRSKNAGPLYLTFDVLVADDASFERLRRSPLASSEALARLLRVAPEAVRVIEHPTSRAVKVTIPRPVIAGDPGDRDIYGAQQYVPLLDLEIPD
jgi:hypothetical protein